MCIRFCIISNVCFLPLLFAEIEFYLLTLIILRNYTKAGITVCLEFVWSKQFEINSSLDVVVLFILFPVDLEVPCAMVKVLIFFLSTYIHSNLHSHDLLEVATFLFAGLWISTYQFSYSVVFFEFPEHLCNLPGNHETVMHFEPQSVHTPRM